MKKIKVVPWDDKKYCENSKEICDFCNHDDWTCRLYPDEPFLLKDFMLFWCIRNEKCREADNQ